MFTYNRLEIISAVPIDDIMAYFSQIGAKQVLFGTYVLEDIEITVTPYEITTFRFFNAPRHAIYVTGDRATAEQFLTNFRLRFLSVGG